MKPANQSRCLALRVVSSVAALVSVANAQNQIWIEQLGTTTDDLLFASAPDGAGGVYSGGNTWGSLGGPNAGNFDAWLARHDSAGNQTWVRQLGSSGYDIVRAASPDGAGGVYVSGYTHGGLGGPNAGSFDAWLARYDSVGDQTWIRQLGSSGDDSAWAAAPDGAGGVYVSGWTTGSLGAPNPTGNDVWLARFDGAGSQIWIRHLGSPGWDFVRAAAPDDAGGVYLGGDTNGSFGGPNAGAEDVWLARYDRAGSCLWIHQLGTPVSDRMFAAASDAVGGVYLGGNTRGSLGGSNAGNTDAWLARYDSAGHQTWIQQLGSSGEDWVVAAAIDGAGGVYVSGGTMGSLGGPSAGNDDVWLARYDGAGSQTWIRQLGSDNTDWEWSAAPDGAGGVYLSGWTNGSLGGPTAGGLDVWLARYDGGLDTLRYCTPAVPNSTSASAAMAAIGSNAVFHNDVTLHASHLPHSAFGFFLASRHRGDVYPIENSQGRLCLGGFIGRFVAPGQILSSGTQGSISLAIDLTSMPTAFGSVAVQPGETWHFQAWHRDANPTVTSNFTDAVSVTFR